MIDEKKLGKLQAMSEEGLDNVAGGTRQDFENVCGALGKSPTFNTRDGIRKMLAKDYGIECVHWNTGERGSSNNAPAEFRNCRTGNKMSTEQVIGVIKGEIDINSI